MASRKRVKPFNPGEYLSGLIEAIERLPDLRPEPAAGFEALAERAQAAFAEFMAGVERLHRVEGGSSGVTIKSSDRAP